MTRRTIVILLGLSILTSACSLNRAGVASLSQAEDEYFGKLRATLVANRTRLQTGLDAQLQADRERERNVLDWQRDLERAEIILSQKTGVIAGQRRLLYMKLAEADLAAVEKVAALDEIDRTQRDVILALYDKVIEAAGALERNNATILKYLASRDSAFALRSLDVDGLFRVVGSIQATRRELDKVDAEAREQQKKRIETSEKAVERARDLLIRIYSR
jgi:hypothetical protein